MLGRLKRGDDAQLKPAVVTVGMVPIAFMLLFVYVFGSLILPDAINLDLANLPQWPADLSIQSISAEGKATTSRPLSSGDQWRPGTEG